MEMVKNSDSTKTVQSKALLWKNLRLPCIIGFNPHEREDKQLVVLNLETSRGPTRTEETDYQKEFGPFIKVCSGFSVTFP
jgi:dihydroneopterin aldolase